MRARSVSRFVAAALVGACGCSFIAVRRAPAPPAARDVPIECTQSRVAPALDTAGAIVTPLAGLTLWGLCIFTSAMQSWSSDPKQLSCGLVLGGTLLSTAAFTGSAVYGYRATAECRRITEQGRTTALRSTCPAPAILVQISPDSVGSSPPFGVRRRSPEHDGPHRE